MTTKVIVINSCKECPRRGYTESDDYCKEMPMEEERTWRRLNDISIVHELCPLKALDDILNMNKKEQ